MISWVWHHTAESGTIVYVQILQKSCPTPQFLPRNWKLFHNISKSCTANILQELHQPARKSHSKLALLSSTTFKRAFLLIKAIRHEICHSVSFSNQVPSFLFDSRERNYSLLKIPNRHTLSSTWKWSWGLGCCLQQVLISIIPAVGEKKDDWNQTGAL